MACAMKANAYSARRPGRLSYPALWRGGRVVEGARLESV